MLWTVEIKLSAVLVKTKKQKQAKKPNFSHTQFPAGSHFDIYICMHINTYISSKEEDTPCWRKAKNMYVIIGSSLELLKFPNPLFLSWKWMANNLLFWVKIICSSFKEKRRSYPPDSEFVHSWLCGFNCSLESTVYIFIVLRHRQSSNSSVLFKGSLCVPAQECKALCELECHGVSYTASLRPMPQPRWFQMPGQKETNIAPS